MDVDSGFLWIKGSCYTILRNSQTRSSISTLSNRLLALKLSIQADSANRDEAIWREGSMACLEINGPDMWSMLYSLARSAGLCLTP